MTSQQKPQNDNDPREDGLSEALRVGDSSHDTAMSSIRNFKEETSSGSEYLDLEGFKEELGGYQNPSAVSLETQDFSKTPRLQSISRKIASLTKTIDELEATPPGQRSPQADQVLERTKANRAWRQGTLDRRVAAVERKARGRLPILGSIYLISILKRTSPTNKKPISSWLI